MAGFQVSQIPQSRPIASWPSVHPTSLNLFSHLSFSIHFGPIPSHFHPLHSGLCPSADPRRLQRLDWSIPPRNPLLGQRFPCLGLKPHFSQTANPFQTFLSLPLLPLLPSPSYSPSPRRTLGTSVSPLRIRTTSPSEDSVSVYPARYLCRAILLQWINSTTHQGYSALIGGYLSLQSSVQLQFSPKRSLPAPTSTSTPTLTSIRLCHRLPPSVLFFSSLVRYYSFHISNSPRTACVELIGSDSAGLLGPTDLVDHTSLGTYLQLALAYRTRSHAYLAAYPATLPLTISFPFVADHLLLPDLTRTRSTLPPNSFIISTAHYVALS